MLKLFAGIAALFLGVGSSAFAQIEGGVISTQTETAFVMPERKG